MKKIKRNHLIVIALLIAFNYGTLISKQTKERKIDFIKKNRIFYFKIKKMDKILSRIPCINWKFKIEGPAEIEIFFKFGNRFKKIFKYHGLEGSTEYNHFNRSDKCFKSFNKYRNNKNIKIFFYRITWKDPYRVTTKTIVLK
jgi:hypothetical protein